MARQTMAIWRELKLTGEQALPWCGALAKNNGIEHLEVFFPHIKHILFVQEARQIQIAIGKELPAHTIHVGKIARRHFFEILRGEWDRHTIGKIVWLPAGLCNTDHKTRN